MELLTFAHLGEARQFLQNLPVQARFDIAPGLYLGPKTGALITGEGMDQVFLKLGSVLGKIAPLERVYNFGIAASVSPKLSPFEVVSVRTAYRYLVKKMEFKSYSSSDTRATYDCVSVFERAKGQEEINKISHFADILDRELWAIAATCHFHQIPFQSFKLISDHAQAHESCAHIQSQAKKYSHLLFETFCNLPPRKEPSVADRDALPRQLYLTESLRRQFTALKKRWQGKYPDYCLNDLYTDEIKNLDISAKKKAIMFLQKIQDRLSPIGSNFRKELDALIGHYCSDKIRIHYDPKLESGDLKIQLDISSREDLDSYQNWAKNFPLEKIQQKIAGPNVQ